MKSWDERWDEIREDPVKLKRVFTVIWVVAYGMLMLGAFLLIAIFAAELLQTHYNQGGGAPAGFFTTAICFFRRGRIARVALPAAVFPFAVCGAIGPPRAHGMVGEDPETEELKVPRSDLTT